MMTQRGHRPAFRVPKEGCTWVTSQVRELSYIQSRDVTFALFCQGPYKESAKYRDFMGWEMPWYSAQRSLDTLLVGRRVGMMHIVCYLRQESKVFETYWTTIRGVEAMDNSYRLLDLTVCGRQESWEDSPSGWPQQLDAKDERHPHEAPHRPVVSPAGGIFGRPRHCYPLTNVRRRWRHFRFVCFWHIATGTNALNLWSLIGVLRTKARLAASANHAQNDPSETLVIE
jgi:hypothetical protein